jgi:hypothetical protein
VGSTGFVVQPRRWVVERALGWFGRWRRLSKHYEALPEVSEAMVTLTAIRAHKSMEGISIACPGRWSMISTSRPVSRVSQPGLDLLCLHLPPYRRGRS